jgi:hypothetical protein
VHEVADEWPRFADTVACKTLGKCAIFRLARFCRRRIKRELIAGRKPSSFFGNTVNHHICVMLACYTRVSVRYL